MRTENDKILEKGMIIGGIVGILVGVAGGAFGVKSCNPYFIKQEESVQTPYVPTKGIEISLRDQDNNGELETYLKLGDKEYALVFDSLTGKPVCLEYLVKPAEVVPKPVEATPKK